MLEKILIILAALFMFVSRSYASDQCSSLTYNEVEGYIEADESYLSAILESDDCFQKQMSAYGAKISSIALDRSQFSKVLELVSEEEIENVLDEAFYVGDGWVFSRDLDFSSFLINSFAMSYPEKASYIAAQMYSADGRFVDKQLLNSLSGTNLKQFVSFYPTSNLENSDFKYYCDEIDCNVSADELSCELDDLDNAAHLKLSYAKDSVETTEFLQNCLAEREDPEYYVPKLRRLGFIENECSANLQLNLFLIEGKSVFEGCDEALLNLHLLPHNLRDVAILIDKLNNRSLEASQKLNAYLNSNFPDVYKQ